MTAKIIRLRPLSGHALEAATDWILAELDGEPASLEAMRAIAEREFARPRDAIHRRWSETFLREINSYTQDCG